MRENDIKKKLAAGEVAIGCFYRYRDPDLAEMISLQGFDFLVIDAEHGTIVPSDCQAIVRSAELHHVAPFVRVPNDERSTLLQYMDTGVLGAQVPMIETAESASEVVKSIKYQPVGQRGHAGSRAADYGQKMSLAHYIRYANEETLIAIQIETRQGLEALPQILKMDAVDVLFLGPTDMSNSLGHPGDLDHPDVVAVFDHVTTLTLNAGKTLGVMVGSADAAQQWIDRGARYIVITLEAMLRDGCQRYLAGAKAHKEEASV